MPVLLQNNEGKGEQWLREIEHKVIIFEAGSWVHGSEFYYYLYFYMCSKFPVKKWGKREPIKPNRKISCISS